MKAKAIALSKGMFTPFDKIDKKTFLIALAIEWVFLLFIWQMNSGELIPKPTAIFTKLFEVFQTSDFIHNLIESLLLTMKAIFFATAIALLLSYGYVINAVRPFVEFIIKIRYLPLTGIVFVFSVMFPNGGDLKLVLLLFGIVPFFVTSMVSAIEEIDPQKYELAKTIRMNRWQTLWEVVIRGKFDYVFEVMRQNFAICWLMITMVEGLSMSEGGIGTMLIKQSKTFELAYVFAIQLTLFGLGILFDWGLSALRVVLFKNIAAQKNR